MMIALPTTPRYKERNAAGQRRRGDPDDDAAAREARRPDRSAPNYISPVLLRLIASNAPLELDVFGDLMRRRKLRPRNGYRAREHEIFRSSRKDPVEALLETIREYNKVSGNSGAAGDSVGKDQIDTRRERERNDTPSCSRACTDRNSGEWSKTSDSGEKTRSRERGRNRVSSEEKRTRGCSSSKDKGNHDNRSCSRDCLEKYVRERECGEKGRPGSGRSNHPRNLPKRPHSARDGSRPKETSVLDRPWSARDMLPTGATVDPPVRRLKSKRSVRSSSQDSSCLSDDGYRCSRDGLACEFPNGRAKKTCDLDSPLDHSNKHKQQPASTPNGFRRPLLEQGWLSLQEVWSRPASAGPVLASERTKPLWFRQASTKALLALEKNLYTKLNIDDSAEVGGEQASLLLKSSKSRLKDEEISSSCLKSIGIRKNGNNCSYARPVTAPAIRSDTKTTEEIPTRITSETPVPEKVKVISGKVDNQKLSPRKILQPKTENSTDLQGVQHAWVDGSVCSTDTEFPITKKFVEDKRCFTAPSWLDTPRRSVSTPRKEKLRAPKENEEHLVSRYDEEENDIFKDYIQEEFDDMKDCGNSPSTCSSDLECEDLEEVYQENTKPPEHGMSVKPKKSSNCLICSEKDVKDLFKGVHESLLASTRLAEVVDLCSKRGQELLRARESMAVEKAFHEKSRWPFKVHRSRQSKAHRRALRAELKWSIFSNGGKLRALNPIYGGKPRIRFVAGIDRYPENPKQTKRPNTAPADVQRTPREENAQDRGPDVSSSGVRRSEGIGPWAPTPESNEIRFRHVEVTKYHEDKCQKKRLPLGVQKDPQQFLEGLSAFVNNMNQKNSNS